MKKQDLTSGHTIHFRDGSNLDLNMTRMMLQAISKDYNDDLTVVEGSPNEYDIVKVTQNGQTVWERSNALDEIADMGYEIDTILAGFENQLGDWEDVKRARKLLLDLVCKIKGI